MAKRNPANSASDAPPASRRGVAFIGIGLFLLAVLTFLPALRYGFINLDDDVYVYENTHIQHGLDSENIRWALTTFDAGFWHPLTWLSFLADHQFHGMNGAGYHLTNILLHAASTVLLFWLFRSMTGAVWRSAFVAALFAVHPLHVEPVVWVASRKDVLSTVFWMLSLLLYVRYTRKAPGWRARSLGFYLGSLLCFAGGLMSKTMVVTLPVILLLLDWWPLRRVPPELCDWKRATLSQLILEKLPFFALAFVCGLLTVHAEKKVGAMEAVSGTPLGNRISNAVSGLAHYLVQMAWPAGMAPFYPYPKIFPVGPVAGAALLLLALTALAFGAGRKHPYLAFGWIWYIVTVLPVSGLIQVGSHSRADRYTYVPLIGIFTMIAWGVYELTRRRPRHVVFLSAAGGAVIFLCLLQARIQIGYWVDSETLFRHTLAVTEQNHFAHNNFGLAVLDKGRPDEAILHFQEALRIEPGYARPRNNLGIALLDKGRMDDAIAEFQTALASPSEYGKVCYNLGVALLRKGQPRDAAGYFQKALESHSDLAKVHYGLGSALLRTGDPAGAAVQFRNALQLEPDFGDAHHELGLAVLRLGNVDEAIAQFREALKLHPDAAETCYNLGLCLLRQGRADEAIPQLQKAVTLQPDLIEARQELAGALVVRGRSREAITLYQAAIDTNPTNVVVLNNLSWMLATSPDGGVRDGARATELAQKATELSRSNNPSILGTLAAAYAESGRMTDAVTSAQHALDLASAKKASGLAATLRVQLETYQAGKPFRDSPATNAVP